MARGRQKGQIVERKEKPKGYIVINNELRIRVETDCIILEELIGKPDKDNEISEDNYGNYKYFTSWNGVLDYLIRRFTTEKVSKKKLLTFQEAKAEIKLAIKECKELLIGEIDKEMKSASREVKESIKKFNK